MRSQSTTVSPEALHPIISGNASRAIRQRRTRRRQMRTGNPHRGAPTEKSTTMTAAIMNRLLGAAAFALTVVGGNISADASVRLPAEQISGMPSLAPLLKEI